jgi:hypothetical protein
MLSGCTAGARGFVSFDDGQYQLEIFPRCTTTVIKQVIVEYITEDENTTTGNETVWAATVDNPQGVKSVPLFTPSTGVHVESALPDIDFSRPMLLWWDEGDDFEDHLIGTLGGLQPGQVMIGSEGYEDRESAIGFLSRFISGC